MPGFLAGVGHSELQQGLLSTRGIYLVKDDVLKCGFAAQFWVVLYVLSGRCQELVVCCLTGIWRRRLVTGARHEGKEHERQ